MRKVYKSCTTVTSIDNVQFDTALGKIINQVQSNGQEVEVQYHSFAYSTYSTQYSALILGYTMEDD